MTGGCSASMLEQTVVSLHQHREHRKSRSGEEFTFAHVGFRAPMKHSGEHLGLNLTREFPAAETSHLQAARLGSSGGGTGA